MKLCDDWVFGGFGRGLCEGYYEIYCENFVVAVGCGLSESWIHCITWIMWVLGWYVGSLRVKVL